MILDSYFDPLALILGAWVQRLVIFVSWAWQVPQNHWHLPGQWSSDASGIVTQAVASVNLKLFPQLGFRVDSKFLLSVL